MYYSAGTYEAFVKPEKPEGVEKKSAIFTSMFSTRPIWG